MRDVEGCCFVDGTRPAAVALTMYALVSGVLWNHPRASLRDPSILEVDSIAMTGQSYDDDYIANLLTKDAKTAKKTYELVGIDAFSSKRYVTTLTGGAPWEVHLHLTIAW
jgi:hypothetical protein